MCNFIDDCPEMDDEETCPPEFTFDICDTLEDCHWYEETPGDDLNFNIMKGMGEYSIFSILLYSISIFTKVFTFLLTIFQFKTLLTVV